MANRTMGKISFLDIQDGSGKIQLFLSKSVLDEQSNTLLKEIDIGDILGATGIVFRTRSQEPTVQDENTNHAVKIAYNRYRRNGTV